MRLFQKSASAALAAICCMASAPAPAASYYPLVGTQQDECYDNSGTIACPKPGTPFFGQDGTHPGTRASYQDDQDGTILDNVTGLIWTRDPGERVTWEQARANAAALRIGGFDDWRLPTVKELYSLMDFRGHSNRNVRQARPYIDTRYFAFSYGDVSRGERLTDAQEWSSTPYVGHAAAFTVNFANGRVEGHSFTNADGTPRKLYARYVRGHAYGGNAFEEGVGGVVIDHATNLVWQRADDGRARTWEEALAYCDGLYLSGRADWHLPSAKELQSIVDYSRAGVPLHPFFNIHDSKGYFWTGTTVLEGPFPEGAMAAYVAFGKAMGYAGNELVDAAGAGAVRSEPKAGDPDTFAHGFSGNNDDVRIRNYVRCVAPGE